MSISDILKRPFANTLAKSKARELQEGAARKALPENAAQRKQDYDNARQSMLGEFSASPIAACQECIASAKAARRKERLDLVSRAIVACPQHADEAARLRKDMDEVENMRCAKHVYLANDPNAPEDLRDNPPAGFLKPTTEQLAGMGLEDEDLNPKGTQFKAAVYMKDPAVWGDNPKPAAVVAFRGSTPAEEDWHNNFDQDANAKQEASYYRRAVTIGNKLADKEAEAQIVGHSLGGGLASAAQGGSGLPASTYNAAGLNPATVARYSQDANHKAADAGKITAIRVKGEVLTKTQENGLTGLLASTAVGTKRDIEAATSEEDFAKLKAEGKVDKKDDYETSLHGMDEVIAATEKEKQSDETALKDCCNKGRK